MNRDKIISMRLKVKVTSLIIRYDLLSVLRTVVWYRTADGSGASACGPRPEETLSSSLGMHPAAFQADVFVV
jgi:hypothetical protein